MCSETLDYLGKGDDPAFDILCGLAAIGCNFISHEPSAHGVQY